MLPTYRFNSDISNPGALADEFYNIGKNFQIRALDGYGHNMNPDMAGQDMTKFLDAAYGDRGFGYQDTLVDSLGGNKELFRAYLELGVTGAGDSYADQQMRGMIQPILEQYGSSLGSEGNPGSTAGAGNRVATPGIEGALADTTAGVIGAGMALPGARGAITQGIKAFTGELTPFGINLTDGDPTFAAATFLYGVAQNYMEQPAGEKSVNNAIGQQLGFTAADSYAPPDNNFGFTGDIDNGPLFSSSNPNSLGTPPSSANNAAGNATESDAP
jgi:hypothetical protein